MHWSHSRSETTDLRLLSRGHLLKQTYIPGMIRNSWRILRFILRAIELLMHEKLSREFNNTVPEDHVLWSCLLCVRGSTPRVTVAVVWVFAD